MRAAPADEKVGRSDEPAVDLGAVAEAIDSADQTAFDDWRTEADLWEATELTTSAYRDRRPGANGRHSVCLLSNGYVNDEVMRRDGAQRFTPR